jgi:transposase-like protein
MKKGDQGGQKSLPSCPNPSCAQAQVVRNGSLRGRQRYLCKTCHTFFGETQGTPMYGLKTPAAEVAQALLIVMRRGSLRAAEEITGHKYETIGVWLKRAAAHAEALTAVLASDLHLSAVEIDEFWSFVGKKKSATSSRTKGSVGDA